MALSRDPAKRRRQLANLRTGPKPPKGNKRGVVHGGYAHIVGERLEAKAREVYDALAADAPVRASGGGLPRYDAPLVRLLAMTLCRLENVEAHIALFGAFDQRSREVRTVVEVEAGLRKEAAHYLGLLGMTPTSRAKLGLDLVRQADLATAMSEPDPERRADLLREAGLPGDVIEGEVGDG